MKINVVLLKAQHLFIKSKHIGTSIIGSKGEKVGRTQGKRYTGRSRNLPWEPHLQPFDIWTKEEIK